MNKDERHNLQRVVRWLKNNGISFAGWTAGDMEQLLCATVRAHEYVRAAPDRAEDVALAFGRVVRQMRPPVQAVAYHVVAQVSDWSQRDVLWQLAGCPDVERQRCEWEPGGVGWRGLQRFLAVRARAQADALEERCAAAEAAAAAAETAKLDGDGGDQPPEGG